MTTGRINQLAWHWRARLGSRSGRSRCTHRWAHRFRVERARRSPRSSLVVSSAEHLHRSGAPLRRDSNTSRRSRPEGRSFRGRRKSPGTSRAPQAALVRRPNRGHRGGWLAGRVQFCLTPITSDRLGALGTKLFAAP